jgi:hypothetical protein
MSWRANRRSGIAARALPTLAAVWAGLPTPNAQAGTSLVLTDPLQLRIAGNGASFLIATSDRAVRDVPVSVSEPKTPAGTESHHQTCSRPRVHRPSHGHGSSGRYPPGRGDDGSVRRLSTDPLCGRQDQRKDTESLLKTGTITIVKPEIAAPSLKDAPGLLERPLLYSVAGVRSAPADCAAKRRSRAMWLEFASALRVALQPAEDCLRPRSTGRHDQGPS